jgi:hypothetical protein
MNYYRKLSSLNEERTGKLKSSLEGSTAKELLQTLPGDYPGIEMSRLPKGLEKQAMIEVMVGNLPAG